ncbi:hypothetical protein E9993_15105 [Labilibacter sediminis]|nr:hypothetical protein E9993_15105 [Labilibacter sediminis]
MKIVTHCNSCKADIKIKTSASTRPDLQMEKGDEIKVDCLNCGNTENKHVNDFKAEPNQKLILISVGLGIVATAILWNFYGAIGTISISIPLLFWKQQINATKAFNSYMIRRR